MKKHLISIIVLFLLLSTSFVGVSNPQKRGFTLIDDIIWDNGDTDNFSDWSASEYASNYPFNAQTADDFLFETTMEINGISWRGHFQSPPEIDPCNFNIYFYADDGTGNAPTGGGLQHPETTALASYLIQNVSGFPLDPYGWYQYQVNLTQSFTCKANEKYWLVVQAVLDYPPLWMWATNGNNPNILSSAVHGFPLIEVPYWTTYEDCGMAFYLIGGPISPPPEPVVHGPTDGVVNVEYNFWTDPVTDPSGDSLYCRWDWGDGNITDWLGPYPSGYIIYASHNWEDASVYDIRAKLKGSGGESDWSEPHTITIVQNEPPPTPLITGPSEGKPGIIYTYELMATVNEGDAISYYIDWGDNTSSGWIGPYLSGQEETANHSWAKKGTYIIKVKAMDCLGIESAWGTLQVKIPKSYNIPCLQFWMRLLERFPNAFPILRFLLDFN